MTVDPCFSQDVSLRERATTLSEWRRLCLRTTAVSDVEVVPTSSNERIVTV